MHSYHGVIIFYVCFSQCFYFPGNSNAKDPFPMSHPVFYLLFTAIWNHKTICYTHPRPWPWRKEEQILVG